MSDELTRATSAKWRGRADELDSQAEDLRAEASQLRDAADRYDSLVEVPGE